MDEKIARMYVRHLRYIYQESIVLALVIFLAILPIWNAAAKMIIIFAIWGLFVIWRGQYFKLGIYLRKKMMDYSKKIKKHRENYNKSSKGGK